MVRTMPIAVADEDDDDLVPITSDAGGDDEELLALPESPVEAEWPSNSPTFSESSSVRASGVNPDSMSKQRRAVAGSGKTPVMMNHSIVSRPPVSPMTRNTGTPSVSVSRGSVRGRAFPGADDEVGRSYTSPMSETHMTDGASVISEPEDVGVDVDLEDLKLERHTLKNPRATHLKLMLRQELMLKRRQPCATVCELLAPTICMVLLIAALSFTESETKPGARYDTLDPRPPVFPLGEILCVAAPAGTYDVPPLVGLRSCPDAGVTLCRESSYVGDPGVQVCVLPGRENSTVASFFLPLDSDKAAKEAAELIQRAFMYGTFGTTEQPAPLLDFDDFYAAQWSARMLFQQTWPGAARIEIANSIDALLTTGTLEFALADGPSRERRCDVLSEAIDYLRVKYGDSFDYYYRDSQNRLEGAACPGVWDSEGDAVRHAMAVANTEESDTERRVWAVVVLRDTDVEAGRVDFLIRMNATAAPHTEELQAERAVWGLGERAYGKYHFSGFTMLQAAVTDALMAQRAAPAAAAVWASPHQQLHTPMPTHAYTTKGFYWRFADLTPMVLSFFFAPGVSVMCTALVREKESRQREGLFIMGLSRLSFFAGKFIVFAGMNFITALVMALAGLELFPGTSILVTLILFFMYALLHSMLALVLSAFFSKARLAGFVSPLFVLAAAFPAFILAGKLEAGTQFALSWLPAFPFANAVRHIMASELGSAGMSMADVHDGEYSIVHSILFMGVDCVLYLVLSQYLEAVLPSEWGVKKHPLFFLPCFREGAGDAGAAMRKHTTPPPDAAEAFDEATAADMAARAVVNIKQLFKVFPGKGVPAVDRLGTGLPEDTLRFYKGQIQVVLGHNGAGKTSLINLLTGLLAPSGGDCTIFGKSIKTDMREIRQDIGLCPQHNILWDSLTCREHLKFFAALKGVPAAGGVLDDLVAKMLRLVKLDGKEDAYATTLSGGQKRKLSVAIAFIGAPRFVVMDEPTAGMDVEARRAMWQLLRMPLLLEDRCVLLTTHFMDEADLLGDSVAIMEAGHLHSIGSPFFLKQKFGAGYNLSLTLEKGTRFRDLVEMVRGHLPDMKKLSSGGNELSLQLPSHVPLTDLMIFGASITPDVRDRLCAADDRLEAATALLKSPATSAENARALKKLLRRARVEKVLPRVLKAIDAEVASGRVKGYGISVTTLEEIFMMIAMGGLAGEALKKKVKPKEAVSPASPSVAGSPLGQDRKPSVSLGLAMGESFCRPPPEDAEEEEEAPPKVELYSLCDPEHTTRAPPLAGAALLWNQYRSLISKRLNVVRRDRQTLILQFFLPVFFICVACGLASITYPDRPALELNPAQYHDLLDAEHAAAMSVPIAFMPLTAHAVFQCAGEEPGKGNDGQHRALKCPAFGGSGYTVFDAGRTSYDLHSLLDSEFYHHRSNQAVFGFAADANAPSNRDDREALANASTVATSIAHNATFHAALPTAVTELLDANAKAAFGADAGVTIGDHPLPYSEYTQRVLDATGLVTSALVVTVPFCLLPTNYIVYAVRERESKAKTLQLISGVKLTVYWLSMFVFDFLAYVVTMLLIMVVFTVAERKEYVGDADTVQATLTLLSVYGVASILYSYAASFLFKKQMGAQVTWCGWNFLGGFGLVVQTYMWSYFSGASAANDFLKVLYKIISPSFCVGEGLVKLALVSTKAIGQKNARVTIYDTWEWEGVLGNVVVMALMIPVHLLMIYLAEHVPRWRVQRRQRRVKKLAAMQDEHSRELLEGYGPRGSPASANVQKVRDAILGGSETENDEKYGVVVKNLKKCYAMPGGQPMKTAVNDITFGVPKDGLFAFLGTNGAGKTTTMSIMTGEQVATAGTVSVEGYDVVEDIGEVRKRLGFCPQFDALIDQLSVEEHLDLYTRLRGLPAAEAKDTVETLIDVFGLESYRTKPTKSLSGGNKRKVSVAISLIGGPRVVVLDEPSAGMDPVARRALWLVLKGVCEGRSVILTTHHLEEVEGLNESHPTVCIMVSAQVKCMGTLQELKAEYGESYKLELRASDPAAERKIKDFVGQVLCPSARLEEATNLRLTYRVPRTIPIGEYFERIEKQRRKLGIVDYTVTETSLEQVFMKISNDALAVEAEDKAEAEAVEVRGRAMSLGGKARETVQYGLQTIMVAT